AALEEDDRPAAAAERERGERASEARADYGDVGGEGHRGLPPPDSQGMGGGPRRWRVSPPGSSDRSKKHRGHAASRSRSHRSARTRPPARDRASDTARSRSDRFGGW